MSLPLVVPLPCSGITSCSSHPPDPRAGVSFPCPHLPTLQCCSITSHSFSKAFWMPRGVKAWCQALWMPQQTGQVPWPSGTSGPAQDIDEFSDNQQSMNHLPGTQMGTSCRGNTHSTAWRLAGRRLSCRKHTVSQDLVLSHDCPLRINRQVHSSCRGCVPGPCR